MYDEMSMGTTDPWNEECVQVGEGSYLERAREEAPRFIELIRPKLGPEPPGARLKIKRCLHDFAAYLAARGPERMDDAIEMLAKGLELAPDHAEEIRRAPGLKALRNDERIQLLLAKND